MKAKGMKALVPAMVFEAALNRKQGYLDDFMGRAILKDGIFYLSPEDYKDLRTTYQLNPGYHEHKRKEREKAGRKIVERGTVTRDVRQFWDLDEPCPKPEWEELRQAYQEEIEMKKATGCSGCQLNKIKQKYKNILDGNNTT